jgi:peptidoglycan/xylan/chitin deacetylase (PgdA/CDA1 family)
VPGWVIEKYPAQIDLLAKHGHEIGLHGYLHERSNEIGEDDELCWFGRGLDAYKRRLGNGPRGWRAPSFAFSKHSLGVLLDAGIEYDSAGWRSARSRTDKVPPKPPPKASCLAPLLESPWGLVRCARRWPPPGLCLCLLNKPVPAGVGFPRRRVAPQRSG